MKVVLSCLMLLVLIQVSAGRICRSGYIACHDSSCIPKSNLCDGDRHNQNYGYRTTLSCSGGEDENETFCNHYNPKNCPKGEVACTMLGRCTDWITACNNDSCYMRKDSAFCQSLLNGTIPTTLEIPKPTCEIDVPTASSEEMQNFLATLNNASTGNEHGCPPFYNNITNNCVAFLPFQMTWPEALEACESISGQLIELDIKRFAGLVAHIQKRGLISDYWIGGFFDITSSDWRWVNGNEMPLGTPFWTVLHSNQCKRRQLAMGRLGEDSANCFSYYQAPSKDEAGQCVALQYENLHYFSDEPCTYTKKPLCYFV